MAAACILHMFSSREKHAIASPCVQDPNCLAKRIACSHVLIIFIISSQLANEKNFFLWKYLTCAILPLNATILRCSKQTFIMDTKLYFKIFASVVRSIWSFFISAVGAVASKWTSMLLSISANVKAGLVWFRLMLLSKFLCVCVISLLFF